MAPNYTLNLSVPAGAAGPNCASSSPAGECDLENVKAGTIAVSTLTSGVINGMYVVGACSTTNTAVWCYNTDIGASVNAAWSACMHNCTVAIVPGSYAQATTITRSYPQTESLVGLGPKGSVILTYTGSGAQINTQAYQFQLFFSQTSTSGELRNLTLVRTNANATNIHAGDTVGDTWEDLNIYSTATSDAGKCIYIENSADNYVAYAGWFERNVWRHVQTGSNLSGTATTTVGGCAYGVYALQTGGTASLGYNNLEVYQNTGPGQVGIYFDGSGSTSAFPLSLYNGELHVVNNMASNSAQTLAPPAAIRMTQNSAVFGGLFKISGENQVLGSGSMGTAYAIDMPTGSNAYFTGCGIIAIRNTTYPGKMPATGMCGSNSTTKYGLTLENYSSVYSLSSDGTQTLPLITMGPDNYIYLGTRTGGPITRMGPTGYATSSIPDMPSTPFELYGNAYAGGSTYSNIWRMQALSNVAYGQAYFSFMPASGFSTSIFPNPYVKIPALSNNAVQTTVAGTTAGSVMWSEPEQGAATKRLMLYFNGYENTTGTQQDITVPAPYTTVEYVNTAMPACAGVTFYGTTVHLPVSMSSTQNGLCIIEGY